MNEKQWAREALTISGVHAERCMKCGKCSGACPSYEFMEYHPHQFVDMILKGEFEKLSNSQSMYKCLSCFVCVERCPRSVFPANIIEAVRTLTERSIGGDKITADMISEMDDVPQQLLMEAFRKFSK
ncbi:MAG: 4Fe-4S dicluster domain-containing protein [Clostridiales bacterium]|nr:4Fe-4S dicluster domain-containing protein [Clostridiales bacterium]